MSRFFISFVVSFFYYVSFAQTVAFPLDQVTPGLTGYAVTAGAGNKLEQFPIEVLALQYDFGIGFPLVLIKASGPFIESTGGIAAGMSGSPVYLPSQNGDALLGAISRVFPESDHSLALVTPIETMRGVATGAFQPFGERLLADLGASVPVSTPLLLSGLSERASTKLETLFRGSDLSPLPVQTSGAGGLRPDETSYKLEPGSAISVQLARGDVTIAGVGTVTEVTEDTLLAFGHELLGQGAVSFPFAPAFVSYIVPSVVVPFKLADNGQTLLGTITQDRPAAVAGTLGSTPELLPITLTLVSEGVNLTKKFEVVNDERYYAPVLAAATLQLFDETRQYIGEGTTELAWDIRFKDGQTLNVLEQISDPNDIASSTAALAASPLDILAQNMYQDSNIESVAINLNYSDVQSIAEIVDVEAKTKTLKPGERLEAYVRLQPYRDEPILRTFNLALPEGATGELEIVFRGGLEGTPEAEGPNEDDEPILSFGELLEAVEANVQSKDLVIETTIEDDKQRLQQETFPYLIAGEETLTITIEDPEAEATEETTPETGAEEEAEEGGGLLQNDSDTPQEEPEVLPETNPEPNEPEPNPNEPSGS
ncbi:MAG: hypothetical protein ACRCYY_21315 [Trueperaceae bacterium]